MGPQWASYRQSFASSAFWPVPRGIICRSRWCLSMAAAIRHGFQAHWRYPDFMAIIDHRGIYRRYSRRLKSYLFIHSSGGLFSWAGASFAISYGMSVISTNTRWYPRYFSITWGAAYIIWNLLSYAELSIYRRCLMLGQKRLGGVPGLKIPVGNDDATLTHPAWLFVSESSQ